MTLTIKIEMDNAIFEENSGSEISRILTNLAEGVDGSDLQPGYAENLRDLNGNTVGSAKVS